MKNKQKSINKHSLRNFFVRYLVWFCRIFSPLHKQTIAESRARHIHKPRDAIILFCHFHDKAPVTSENKESGRIYSVIS